jgi:hypothetical protein
MLYTKLTISRPPGEILEWSVGISNYKKVLTSCFIVFSKHAWHWLMRVYILPKSKSETFSFTHTCFRFMSSYRNVNNSVPIVKIQFHLMRGYSLGSTPRLYGYKAYHAKTWQSYISGVVWHPDRWVSMQINKNWIELLKWNFYGRDSVWERYGNALRKWRSSSVSSRLIFSPRGLRHQLGAQLLHSKQFNLKIKITFWYRLLCNSFILVSFFLPSTTCFDPFHWSSSGGYRFAGSCYTNLLMSVRCVYTALTIKLNIVLKLFLNP